MRNSQAKEFAGGTTGFSLIEVMLALAIIAIGLIAIVGLLPHGVQASRDAADNTVAATTVQDIFSTIRAASFVNVDLNTVFGFTGPAAFVGPYNLQNAYPDVVAYFDQSGFPVDPVAAPQDCYFKVVLNLQPQSPVLSEVTATISWPAKPVMTTFVNTTIFLTRVAQYE